MKILIPNLTSSYLPTDKLLLNDLSYKAQLNEFINFEYIHNINFSSSFSNDILYVPVFRNKLTQFYISYFFSFSVTSYHDISLHDSSVIDKLAYLEYEFLGND
jgi:hypothetical protein